MQIWRWLVLSLLAAQVVSASECIPFRATNAPGGSAVVKRIAALGFTEREEAIYAEVCAGNVPEFWRKFCPVTITNVAQSQTNVILFYAAPDYFAIGSDVDYFLSPLSPSMAQRVADRFGLALPTRKMVDEIWQAAALKLPPTSMTPGSNMVTVHVFAEHNALVRTQRLAQVLKFPLGSLVAGDKKDVVITPRLAEATNRVAIYGWHKTNGQPIQPLYLGHTAAWVDYSHGIRFVRDSAVVNGKLCDLASLLTNSEYAAALSDEGTITNARYDLKWPLKIPSALAKSIEPQTQTAKPSLIEFKPTGLFGERSAAFGFDPEVRVVVNAPPVGEFTTGRPVRLILYALPNGNTIEQTIGKKIAPGDDWHYNIQHIGAQTRWLRQRLTNEILVVAYLEASMKSWPAWRQKHGDNLILNLIETVRGIFRTNRIEIVLTGHSGGGSLTFGYLNAVEKIPDEVSRIAFLDSNYAYRTTNHFQKIADWLRASNTHTLCVLAYQDYLGLLDGKSFVSEQGGTWGRSQEMLRDLSGAFKFDEMNLRDGLKSVTALHGRVTFLLKENPDRKIFHTVQVERNGFIHSQLVGAEYESRGYEYFGDRVYEQLVE